MTKKTLFRLLIMIVAVAAVMLVLPRNDRTTLTYEEGQPWRYALLTAPFDIPVYLDSTTYRHQTDSVTANFSPYVNRVRVGEPEITARLSNGGVSVFKIKSLATLITRAYSEGVMSDALKERVKGTQSRTVRTISDDDASTATSMDAEDMYSVTEACKWVVDNYDPNASSMYPLDSDDVNILNTVLTPNITLDSINDDKYLTMELQNVNASQGKIRQGQRIVDRGEIITPQIYRNLQTYEDMLSKTSDQDRTHELITTAAQFVYVMMVFAMFYLYLAVYRPKVFADIRVMTFMMSLITLFVALSALMFNNFAIGIYLTPFATVPVMVLIFIDSRTAFMSLLVSVLLAVLIATYQYQFIISELITGFMAVVSLNQLSRRSQLLRTSVVIFVTYSVVGVLLVLLSGGEVSKLDWHMFMAYGVNAVLFSLTYVLIVLVEKVFGFTSAVTLVELSDINNPLLRRLSEEAPGTFQHSMQVSTLAADAAHSIGANTQLDRKSVV